MSSTFIFIVKGLLGSLANLRFLCGPKKHPYKGVGTCRQIMRHFVQSPPRTANSEAASEKASFSQAMSLKPVAAAIAYFG